MKTKVIAWTLAACFLGWLVIAATPRPAEVEKSDPLRGIVYYHNQFTGKLGLYVAYELEPNHVYRFDVTDDGVNFTTIKTTDTKGRTSDIYESFNVPNPCEGIWPRVIDLGPSP